MASGSFEVIPESMFGPGQRESSLSICSVVVGSLFYDLSESYMLLF